MSFNEFFQNKESCVDWYAVYRVWIHLAGVVQPFGWQYTATLQWWIYLLPFWFLLRISPESLTYKILFSADALIIIFTLYIVQLFEKCVEFEVNRLKNVEWSRMNWHMKINTKQYFIRYSSIEISITMLFKALYKECKKTHTHSHPQMIIIISHATFNRCFIDSVHCIHLKKEEKQLQFQWYSKKKMFVNDTTAKSTVILLEMSHKCDACNNNRNGNTIFLRATAT